MRKIAAILWKQCKDTIKNKETLIQFAMFPVMAIIMQNAIKIEELPENYFVKMFAAMYVGMAPLTSMAAILSEEKEKRTLRVLLMSNVKAGEYLFGVGIYVFALCMLGSCVFAATGGYRGSACIQFLGVMGAGILISLLLGAAIGIFAKNQMAATSVTVPAMLLCSFLPMISMFNYKVAEISRFLFSQQVSNMLEEVGHIRMGYENAGILILNFAGILVLFVASYRKFGLAD